MQSRKLHALAAGGLFFCIAQVYCLITRQPFDSPRILFWSVAGIAGYVFLSRCFGFDPHRTKLAPVATPVMRYVDRWELRLGQATLSMLGLIVAAAHYIDRDHFVTAVVSGTLSAWTYFALRLYAGGYKAAHE